MSTTLTEALATCDECHCTISVPCDDSAYMKLVFEAGWVTHRRAGDIFDTWLCQRCARTQGRNYARCYYCGDQVAYTAVDAPGQDLFRDLGWSSHLGAWVCPKHGVEELARRSREALPVPQPLTWTCPTCHKTETWASLDLIPQYWTHSCRGEPVRVDHIYDPGKKRDSTSSVTCEACHRVDYPGNASNDETIRAWFIKEGWKEVEPGHWICERHKDDRTTRQCKECNAFGFFGSQDVIEHTCQPREHTTHRQRFYRPEPKQQHPQSTTQAVLSEVAAERVKQDAKWGLGRMNLQLLPSLDEEQLARLEMAAKFWQRVGRDESGCWPWLAGVDAYGYGHMSFRGKLYKSHRLAWELWNQASFPAGLNANHSCDNRPCCNPLHIVPGTSAENSRQASVRGRLDASKRTHCPQGHPYSGANLRLKDNKRSCRECRRLSKSAHYYETRSLSKRLKTGEGSKRKPGKSGFFGVNEHPKGSKKRFQAKIRCDGKTKSLGYFTTAEEAARAYDAAAIALFGDRAVLNDLDRQHR